MIYVFVWQNEKKPAKYKTIQGTQEKRPGLSKVLNFIIISIWSEPRKRRTLRKNVVKPRGYVDNSNSGSQYTNLELQRKMLLGILSLLNEESPLFRIGFFLPVVLFFNIPLCSAPHFSQILIPCDTGLTLLNEPAFCPPIIVKQFRFDKDLVSGYNSLRVV